MSRHTPGPWVVQDNLAHGGQLRVDSEEFGAVAIVRTDDTFAGDTAQADARLIASAPEMLEASVEGARALEFFLESCSMSPDVRRGVTQTLAEMRAAIAKARGES